MHIVKYVYVLTPILPYITWGFVQDLKTRKSRDPKIKKENLNIHIYKRKKLYII